MQPPKNCDWEDSPEETAGCDGQCCSGDINDSVIYGGDPWSAEEPAMLNRYFTLTAAYDDRNILLSKGIHAWVHILYSNSGDYVLGFPGSPGMFMVMVNPQDKDRALEILLPELAKSMSYSGPMPLLRDIKDDEEPAREETVGDSDSNNASETEELDSEPPVCPGCGECNVFSLDGGIRPLWLRVLYGVLMLIGFAVFVILPIRRASRPNWHCPDCGRDW